MTPAPGDDRGCSIANGIELVLDAPDAAVVGLGLAGGAPGRVVFPGDLARALAGAAGLGLGEQTACVIAVACLAAVAAASFDGAAEYVVTDSGGELAVAAVVDAFYGFASGVVLEALAAAVETGLLDQPPANVIGKCRGLALGVGKTRELAYRVVIEADCALGRIGNTDVL